MYLNSTSSAGRKSFQNRKVTENWIDAKNLRLLRTGRPITANLYCFDNWISRDSYGLPFGSFKRFYAVIMLAIRKINGHTFVICKSSNGKRIGLTSLLRYIAVSLEVMLSLLAYDKKEDQEDYSYEGFPHYLLSRRFGE